MDFAGRVGKDVGTAGTHVFMRHGDASYVSKYFDGKFYVGSERVSGDYPYRGWQTAKAWPLNDKLEMHILYFQQVSFPHLIKLY